MISEDREQELLSLIDSADKVLGSSEYKARNEAYLSHVERRSKMHNHGTIGMTPTAAQPQRAPLVHTSVTEAVEAAKRGRETEPTKTETPTAAVITRDKPSRFPRGRKFYRSPAF